VIIELFSLTLTVETLLPEICQSWRFSKGWVTLSANIGLEGDIAYKPLLLVSKYRQCVLSFRHNARVRRTDGPTDGRTDGQNCDSQDSASIVASCGKNTGSELLFRENTGGNLERSVLRLFHFTIQVNNALDLDP